MGFKNVDPDNPEYADAFSLTRDAFADRLGDNSQPLVERLIDTFVRVNAPRDFLLA